MKKPRLKRPMKVMGKANALAVPLSVLLRQQGSARLPLPEIRTDRFTRVLV